MEDEKDAVVAVFFSGLGGAPEANCYFQPPTTFQHSQTIRDYPQHNFWYC